MEWTRVDRAARRFCHSSGGMLMVERNFDREASSMGVLAGTTLLGFVWPMAIVGRVFGRGFWILDFGDEV